MSSIYGPREVNLCVVLFLLWYLNYIRLSYLDLRYFVWSLNDRYLKGAGYVRVPVAVRVVLESCLHLVLSVIPLLLRGLQADLGFYFIA